MVRCQCRRHLLLLNDSHSLNFPRGNVFSTFFETTSTGHTVDIDGHTVDVDGVTVLGAS